MEFNNRNTVFNNPSSYSNEVYTIACNYSGRDYNRQLGKLIIDELLDKMSSTDATEFISYANVLVFIMNGMFYSSAKYLDNITVSSSLQTTLTWLKTTLTNSDSI